MTDWEGLFFEGNVMIQFATQSHKFCDENVEICF